MYFHAMDIGAYGINQHMITLWFDEHPELFAEQYMVQPEYDYVISVPASEEIAIDLKAGDGVKDTLRLWDNAGEFYKNLVIQINGQDEYTEESYLISDADYYDISTDWYTLTLKKPLEMKILPNGKMEEIPAGTTFQYLRTDGETYVDLLMEDGRECRVMTENWDGEPAINGNYPEMYFEGYQLDSKEN